MSRTRLDIQAVKADFPFTRRHIHGHPIVFLDSAASAQKPRRVLEAMTDLMANHYANVHRGVHVLSQEATTAYESVRSTVQTFIGAARPEEIIFTRGATEAINLVAQTWGRMTLDSQSTVLLSEMEHHANIVPWQLLQKALGFQIRVIPITDDGALDMDRFTDCLDERVKLVSLTGMSNTLGTIPALDAIVPAVHQVGATILLDACQLAAHRPVDVQALDIDFLTFSGHKLYGPTGVGVLYGKYSLLEHMPPWQGGGDMIDTVSFSGTTYAPPPARFEAGTPAIAEVVGLGAAIAYLQDLGWPAIEAHERDLLQYALQSLDRVSGLDILGTHPNRGGVLSLIMKGVHPEDMGMVLDRQGIAIRTGHHCAQPLMQKLGLPGTARASFGIYNDRTDVDALVCGLEKVKEMFHV